MRVVAVAFERATRDGAKMAAGRVVPRIAVAGLCHGSMLLKRKRRERLARGRRRREGNGEQMDSKACATACREVHRRALCPMNSMRDKQSNRSAESSGTSRNSEPGNEGGTRQSIPSKSCVQYCKHRWRWEGRNARELFQRARLRSMTCRCQNSRSTSASSRPASRRCR